VTKHSSLLYRELLITALKCFHMTENFENEKKNSFILNLYSLFSNYEIIRAVKSFKGRVSIHKNFLGTIFRNFLQPQLLPYHDKLECY
jgi:hypothetical protein